MRKYKNQTLTEYLQGLSSKTPVPGGGSAAALVASLGVALISMAANYSLNKNQSPSVITKIKDIRKQSEFLRKRFLELVDRDAEAYQKVVKARLPIHQLGGQARRSGPAQKKAALKKARQVPQEVCRLCQKAFPLAAFLAKKGNRHLRSDARIAREFLKAAFRASQVNVEINQ